MTHLTDEQLVARLYGVEDAASRAHLADCAECLERYEVADRRRSLLTGFRPLTTTELSRQRAAIVARIESRPPLNLRWVWAPAALAAVVIGAGLYLSWSAPPLPAPAASVETGVETTFETMDANWYEEVYTGFDLMEPRAASPIRELFAEETASE